MNFGLSDDKPVPGDYDGDGKADIAVFRAGEGYYILRSWNNSLQTLSIYAFHGPPSPQDLPAPYGYGLLDVTIPAIWRPGTGGFVLFVLSSFNEEIAGMDGDIPVTAPYVIE